MKKESRFLVQKKIWWGKSKKGASDQTQTMLALRANKGHEGTDPKFKKEYRALVVSRPCGFLTVLARNAETLRSWDLEIFRIIPIQKGRGPTNNERTVLFVKGRGRNMQRTHGVCILNNRYCTI